MDLRTYLTEHDGAVDRFGRELHRLSKAAKVTSNYTYLCALGHKTPSYALAVRYRDASKNHEIDPAKVLEAEVERRNAAVRARRTVTRRVRR